MLSILRLLLVLIAAATAVPAQATQVEAEGRASIINNDLHSARQAAIRDASQAASMQAAAYISTTQEISNGILSLDDMKIQTLGKVQNIEVIDEWLEGQLFHVRIRAEVIIDTACPGGDTPTRLRKAVTLTLFPLQHPAQANSGDLGSIQRQLPALIAQALSTAPEIEALNQSQFNLIAQPASAPDHQLPQEALIAPFTRNETLQAQFIVTGVIRDLSMRSPVGPREPNILVDWYNRADYASQRHLRRLALDLFIYDSFSGELIEQRHYETEGRWTRPREERTGFGSALFWQQDYGQKVRTLIDTIGQELRDTLRCKPFAARISQTQGDKVWIDAGTAQGLKEGDTLMLYRRLTHYDNQMRPFQELINTHVSVRLEQVQPGLARGRIQGDSQSLNIQRDDIVMSGTDN